MAPPPKLAVTLPSPSTLKWHPAMAPTYCTQQSHHVHSLKVGRHPSSTLQWHPAMAPPPPPTTAHYNGTLQWHPAMAPRPLPQSWSSPSPPPTIAHYNGTLAPSNGTTSAPPKLVVTLPPNHSTLQWHPTMAPSNGTTSTAPCNGTLVPRPIRQSGSSPPPHWK